MIFEKRNSAHTRESNITFSKNNLQRVDHFKYLGIILNIKAEKFFFFFFGKQKVDLCQKKNKNN